MKKDLIKNYIVSNGMKKNIFKFVLVLSFLGIFNSSSAVQLQGATGNVQVTDKTVTVTVNSDLDPSTNKAKVKLDVYDDTTKKVVAGPTITEGKSGENQFNASVDISSLQKSKTYVLRGSGVGANANSDTFTLPFNTVSISGGGANSVCTIQAANFNPSDETPAGTYKDASPMKIQIVVYTTNCIGKVFNLTLFEKDQLSGDDALSKSGLENQPLPAISGSGNFSIDLTAGEDQCEKGAGVGLTTLLKYDCHYYFTLENPDIGTYTSLGQNKGDLYYDCDNACDKLWSYTNYNYIDVGVDPLQDSRVARDEYRLLAPIGQITAIDDKTKFGDYINMMITIFLGLCGAMAVVMIIIYGIQYMGTDSVFGHTEAIKNIQGAVGGLVLALGCWMLLNTINPDLLNTSLTIPSADIELDGTPMTANDTVPADGTIVAECPEGIVTTNTAGGTFPVCKSIEKDLQKMINDAWAANFHISGYGFRTYATQVKLRQQNHCPDIYNSPANACHPPTARPGHSMHESGKAFDLTCDGVTIQAKDNKCFVWLKAHAGSYGIGFKNLDSEPWHWSTTGH